MLTVSMSKNRELLEIKCHFLYKDRIKSNLPVKFDYEKKCWCMRNTKQNLDVLRNNFKGELYFKTPIWKILNMSPPSYDKLKITYDDTLKIPKLNLEPYDYQNIGIKFLIERINKYGFALNSDDVGLGKTLQAIGTLAYFKNTNKDIKKILLICKKSIKTQWREEMIKFASNFFNPDDFLITKDLSTKKRQEIYNKFKEKEEGVLITNYHNFLNDSEYIAKAGFDFVVIDEVHQVKNHEGVMNNKIQQVIEYNNKTKGQTKVLFLTGTPIMKAPEDIFGIVSLANQDFFGDYDDFCEEYLVFARTIYGYEQIGCKNLDVLISKIKDFVIRRISENVSISLPDIIVDTMKFEMDRVQRKMYEVIHEKQEELDYLKQELLDKNNKIPEDKKSEFEKLENQEKSLIPLRQYVANDPRCLLNNKSRLELISTLKDMIPANYKMSNKTEATLDILEDLIESDHKVIIFGRFTTSLDLLAQDIKKRFKNKVPEILTYTGHETDEQRERNINLFKNNSDYLILMGTEAMAEGLNLQVSNYLINFEQADTHAQKVQRIGRIRRVGSEHNIAHVYDMITQETIDENILTKLEQQKDLADILIG